MRRVALFLAVVLGSFFAGRAGLAVIIPQTVNQLADNSTHILRAKVESKAAHWNETHNYIFTYVTLQVKEQYKGKLTLPSMITVVVPGGAVGDTGLTVEHAASFSVGEDVVVFLSKRGLVFDVTSWELGKYTVVNGLVKEKKLPLADFAAAIRKAIKQ